eukprot:9496960-Pyramimonas_sp.AAC.1
MAAPAGFAATVMADAISISTSISLAPSSAALTAPWPSGGSPRAGQQARAWPLHRHPHPGSRHPQRRRRR